MNKLKTSTKVLIAIAAATVILAVVLILTMPEPWAQHINATEFFQKGPSAHFMLENGEETFHTTRGFYKSRGHHAPVFPIFLIAVITFFIIRKKHHGGRKNCSRDILDQQYAEGKINADEYNRKKTVIEEGDE